MIAERLADMVAKIFAERNIVDVDEDRVVPVIRDEVVANPARHGIRVRAAVGDDELWHAQVYIRPEKLSPADVALKISGRISDFPSQNDDQNGLTTTKITMPINRIAGISLIIL
jgi:hypothetical protein